MSRPAPTAPNVGLFGPDSVTWRLHADPLMGIAGLRALLLQALHPVAMAGVAEHSDFREDPWGRLQRTAEYVGTVTYGSAREARRAGAHVRGIHRRLATIAATQDATETEAGRRVDDHDLLRWVHVCLVSSFLDVVRRGGLRLAEGDADAYVEEQVRAAELVGLPRGEVPESEGELGDYLAGMQPLLRASRAAREAARLVLAPPMPRAVAIATPARPAWAAAAVLSAATLPRWARRLYRLPGLPTTDLATTAGLVALRVSLLAVPTIAREGPHLRAARRRLGAGELLEH